MCIVSYTTPCPQFSCLISGGKQRFSVLNKNLIINFVNKTREVDSSLSSKSRITVEKDGHGFFAFSVTPGKYTNEDSRYDVTGIGI
jgi:hypothetical protein